MLKIVGCLHVSLEIFIYIVHVHVAGYMHINHVRLWGERCLHVHVHVYWLGAYYSMSAFKCEAPA